MLIPSLATIVVLAAVLFLLVGMVRPGAVLRWGPEQGRSRVGVLKVGATALVLAIIALGVSVPNKEPVHAPAADVATSAPANTDATLAKALERVRQEPKVVEALWAPLSTANHPMLWISMRDDGSRRDGYAEAMCLTLRDMGVQNAMVVIKDAAAAARGDLRNLGECLCPR